MNKIEMAVNNGGTLTLKQHQHDGEILLARIDNNHITSIETIDPGDMVTLMNWYRYQKANGNTNLSF
jgi:hypothetical protein